MILIRSINGPPAPQLWGRRRSMGPHPASNNVVIAGELSCRVYEKTTINRATTTRVSHTPASHRPPDRSTAVGSLIRRSLGNKTGFNPYCVALRQGGGSGSSGWRAAQKESDMQSTGILGSRTPPDFARKENKLLLTRKIRRRRRRCLTVSVLR